MPPVVGVAAIGFFNLPLVVLPLALGLYHATQARPEERACQQQVVLDLIEARGETDAGEAAKTAGLSTDTDGTAGRRFSCKRRRHHPTRTQSMIPSS